LLSGPADGIYIEVDRGNGWVFLGIDTVPHFIDTTAFPAGGAVWKYRAIYIINDERTGDWGDTASIAVG
jgi:hypothetical protein